MTADSPYSLEALERQWHDGKAPKLGLQLAEEHRRRGDLPAAIEVLETGLEEHPDHLSSRVALSRYLVDSDRYSDALAHLERIVRADPVHLVANKLMVRAFLGLGKLDEARDKLDIYEMLGEGDAEIEGLRARVNGEPEASPTDAPVLTHDAAETSASVVSPSREATPLEIDEALANDLSLSDEAQAEPDAGLASTLDLSDVTGSGPVEAPAPLRLSELSAQEPISDLVLVSEPAEAAEAAEAAEPASGPASGTGSERESDPLRYRAETETVGDEPSEPAMPEPVAQDPFSEDEPFGSAWAQEPSSESASSARGEDIFAVEAPEPARAPPIEPEPAASEPAVSEGEVGESEAEAPVAAGQGSQPSGATVTLARLYLEQGDAEKAAACFREVLERDPGNQAARTGLASIAADEPERPSPKERKKAALIAFRSRIRRAVEGRS